MRNRMGTERGLSQVSQSRLGRATVVTVVAILLLSVTGCSRWRTRRMPTFSNDLQTADQVVAQINRNADRIQALTARDLDITSNQVLVPLDGRLALEKPRRFRLLVRMPATKTTVADIGSNDQEFWFYTSQPSQQASLIHCSYEDYGRVQTRIPFQPDWVFDALGLIPLLAEQGHMLRPGKRGTVELVSPTVTPQGHNASLITVVQSDSGWIVERRLELPGRAQPMAVASLSRHETDPATGAVYPGTVRVAWPDDNLDITIRMQGVEINPIFDAYQARELWELPRNRYPAQDIDLGAGLRMNRTPRQPNAQLGSPGRTRMIESAYP